MVGSGRRRLHTGCGGNRRGGEKPRGRNGIEGLAALDRGGEEAVRIRSNSQRTPGVDAYGSRLERGVTEQRGQTRGSGDSRRRDERPVGAPRGAVDCEPQERWVGTAHAVWTGNRGESFEVEPKVWRVIDRARHREVSGTVAE